MERSNGKHKELRKCPGCNQMHCEVGKVIRDKITGERWEVCMFCRAEIKEVGPERVYRFIDRKRAETAGVARACA